MKFDTNIPIPPRNNTKKHFADEIKVGESYFVEASGEAVAYTTKKVQRSTGKRFTRRKVTEDGVSGYRVWRTE